MHLRLLLVVLSLCVELVPLDLMLFKEPSLQVSPFYNNIHTQFLISNKGASHIIAVDINPKKESTATEFGATHFVNPRAFKEGESLAGHVKSITGANYVDFAYEASGNAVYLSLLSSLFSSYFPFFILIINSQLWSQWCH